MQTFARIYPGTDFDPKVFSGGMMEGFTERVWEVWHCLQQDGRPSEASLRHAAGEYRMVFGQPGNPKDGGDVARCLRLARAFDAVHHQGAVVPVDTATHAVPVAFDSPGATSVAQWVMSSPMHIEFYGLWTQDDIVRWSKEKKKQLGLFHKKGRKPSNMERLSFVNQLRAEWKTDPAQWTVAQWDDACQRWNEHHPTSPYKEGKGFKVHVERLQKRLQRERQAGLGRPYPPADAQEHAAKDEYQGGNA